MTSTVGATDTITPSKHPITTASKQPTTIRQATTSVLRLGLQGAILVHHPGLQPQDLWPHESTHHNNSRNHTDTYTHAHFLLMHQSRKKAAPVKPGRRTWQAMVPPALKRAANCVVTAITHWQQRHSCCFTSHHSERSRLGYSQQNAAIQGVCRCLSHNQQYTY